MFLQTSVAAHASRPCHLRGRASSSEGRDGGEKYEPCCSARHPIASPKVGGGVPWAGRMSGRSPTANTRARRPVHYSTSHRGHRVTNVQRYIRQRASGRPTVQTSCHLEIVQTFQPDIFFNNRQIITEKSEDSSIPAKTLYSLHKAHR